MSFDSITWKGMVMVRSAELYPMEWRSPAYLTGTSMARPPVRTSRTMSISRAKVTASAMALRAVFRISTAGSGVGVREGNAGVAVGPATIGGVGVGMGVAVGVGVGIGVAVGVGVGGTGVAVGVFVGVGVGVGSGSSPQATRKRTTMMSAQTRDVILME